MLEIDSIRQSLKAGPFSEIYAVLRALKRKLRGEPLVGALPVKMTPLSVEPLHALSTQMSGHARLHFSLALAYLDIDTPAGDRRAKACLRNAEFLDFESEERLRLYHAVIAARKGRSDEAADLASAISPYDLTKSEAELRERLVSGEMAANYPMVVETETVVDCWQELPNRARGYSGVNSVLVCGDENAVSSEWAPHAKYLLVSKQVNGIAATGLRAILEKRDGHFDLGIGSSSSMDALKVAGAKCEDWITIETRLPVLA